VLGIFERYGVMLNVERRFIGSIDQAVGAEDGRVRRISRPTD
jgi:hypothetical protein